MKKFLLVVFISVSIIGTLQAQGKKSRKERQQEQARKVEQYMENQDYKFIAQKALPMSARSIDLTSEYDVVVSKDTITAYLPYFGRAYVAPMDHTQGGIKFESKDFEYRCEPAKKDGWIIYIKPFDQQKRYELILRVTSSGSASLSVNDDTRQGISFNGYIDERKKK